MIRPLIALVTVTLPLVVAASVVSENNTQQEPPSVPFFSPAANIQTLIDGAVARGVARVIIPAGEHRLASALRLRKLSGLTIEGDGATLVFTNLKDGGFSITECENLTLRGFTVDFDPLPFTQGTIDAIDPATGILVWTVHDGYPDLTSDRVVNRAHIFAPDTHEWKRDAPDIYATAARALTPRRGQLTFAADRRWQLAYLVPGDHLVQNIRSERGAFRIERSRNLTLDHITVHSAPGVAILLRFMDGQNTFKNLTITPGPPPSGATLPRLFSSSADGFNYAYARTGPILENCDFSRMGDDSVNLHGIAFVVAEADPANNIINLIRPHGRESFPTIIRPGDEVRTLARDNFDLTGVARVVDIDIDPAPGPRFHDLARRLYPRSNQADAARLEKFTLYRLKLDAPLTPSAGDLIEIPATAAPGYIIRNNRFTQHRGRALRILASHGLIEDNFIDGIKQSAITLGHEFVAFREAGWVSDITLRRNTIKNSAFDPGLLGKAAWTPGAISIVHRGETPDTPPPLAARNRDIRIEHNTIENVGGPAIHINQAANILVKNNPITRANQNAATITDSHKNPFGLTTARPIEANNSEHVVIDP
ncbi:right-handed parallel beta-helix repeat-containing protein [Geminisphaera colitermitum]|uniref:right-handed parallel beta-helix repeat-containing protein n=1 Tax=Geminisphaera colitermitum TaxID=1148786 RepID=UPI000158D492|nr:right-handed parallel beta-helix repeat-containing protein [Geminisphaera colitermitum]